MTGPPVIQSALYGDVSKLAQQGIKNNPAEDLPRVVTRPGSQRAPQQIQRGQANLPRTILDDGQRELARAAGRASRNLDIARQAASQPDAGPEIMALLKAAERNYARAMLAVWEGTPNYNLPDDQY